MPPEETPPPGPPGASLAQPSNSAKSPPKAFADRCWHSRGYLPHFESSTAIQHITYRLADSLPARVVAQLSRHLESVPASKRESARRKRFEAIMDAGHGSCVLRVPEIARLVQDNLLFHDGSRYRLLAWVIMPNHLHVLIQPIAPWVVSKIVASWKSYTGAGSMRGALLPGWRLAVPAGLRCGIADTGIVSRATRRTWHTFAITIHLNPVKAGLDSRAEDWPWSSAHYTGVRPPSARQWLRRAPSPAASAHKTAVDLNSSESPAESAPQA